MFDSHLLLIMTLGPAAAAVVLAFVPSRYPGAVRWLSLAVSISTFFAGILLWFTFNPEDAGFQLTEQYDWVPQLGMSFHLGIDGIALVCVVLTTILMPLLIIASWKRTTSHVKSFHLQLLLMSTGLLGSFLSMDLLLFFVFSELCLVPAFFLIGVWGGSRRMYAALKMVVFSLVGSGLLLVAMLYTASAHRSLTGAWSFDYLQWLQTAPIMAATGILSPQLLVFAAFAVAFAIKAGVFPLHTWVPDAVEQSPMAGSVILASLYSSVGVYGFLRFNRSLFPDAWAMAAPTELILGILTLFAAGAGILLVRDLRAAAAYAGIVHVGLIWTGLSAGTLSSTQGALLHTFNLGGCLCALYVLLAWLGEHRGTTDVESLRGLASEAPFCTAALLFFGLAMIGIPGLGTFASGLLIVSGLVQASPFALAAVIIGLAVAVIRPVSVIVGNAWIGKRDADAEPLGDLGVAEILVVLPLAVLILVIGLVPKIMLTPIDAAVRFIIG